MVVLIQESESSLNVLYPAEQDTMKAVFEGDYISVSFNDDETGVPVTVQIHKGTVLDFAKKIQEDISRQVEGR